MDKNRVYSFEGDPAKVIREKDGYAVALVLTRTQTTSTAIMIETPVNTLESWHCPYAEETELKRVYCDENGICQYPMPESAPFAALTGMCMRCLMKSWEAEDENKSN